MTLLNTADAVYLGTVLADRVYAGTEQVWPPASGAGWTPAEIAADIAFWLRPDLLTGAHLSEVTALPDQGPDGLDFGYHMAAAKLLLADQNGLNVLLFDTATLTSASTSFADFMLYVLWKGHALGGNTRLMDHDYAGGFWVGRDYIPNWGGGIKFTSNPYGNWIAPVDSTNWHIGVFGRTGTAGRVRSDGGTLDMTPTVDGTPTASGPVILGGFSSASPTDLSLAEVLMLDANVEAHMEQVEGYLAHKWGLAAILPAGHPYKAAPP